MASRKTDKPEAPPGDDAGAGPTPAEVTVATTVTLPRLAPAIPRSGISEAARHALRQWIGDADRRIADGYRAGAPAHEMAMLRSRAIEQLVVHAWKACVGESSALALFAVGGFGRGPMYPTCWCSPTRRRKVRRHARWNRSSFCSGTWG
jgi:hypothetical protein